MAYRIAGIDVHKKMLAIVIADVAIEGEFLFMSPPGWHEPARPAGTRRLASDLRGRGGGDGIDCAAMASGLYSASLISSYGPDTVSSRSNEGRNASSHPDR